MPTVLRGAGFIVRVLLPPREHGPPHVHVQKAGAVVVINLPESGENLSIRSICGMRDADVLRAYRLVDANRDALLMHWRKYHG